MVINKNQQDVPETQRLYASKIAKKLEENAKTLRGELETATKMYDSGVTAYGRGMYDDAVKWFKAAAEETSETSLLGGRIQIYLALSLDAYGQRDKALDIYTYLESVHPEKSIRKQAEELRFILEAPRMEIGENERVDVPLKDQIRSVDEPSYTILATGHKRWADEKGEVLRHLTGAEGALIQSFPPDYMLPWSPTVSLVGVGNALPPNLARVLMSPTVRYENV